MKVIVQRPLKIAADKRLKTPAIELKKSKKPVEISDDFAKHWFVKAHMAAGNISLAAEVAAPADKKKGASASAPQSAE